MKRLTASGLDVAVKCPGSKSLPVVRFESAAASEGTRKHEFLERMLVEGKESALKLTKIKSQRDWINAIPLDGIRAELGIDKESTVLIEAAYAVSPDFAAVKFLGQGIGRDYSAAPDGWHCGTADIVVINKAEIIVADWKTGRTASDPFWNPEPQENQQLKFLSAAVMLLEGAPNCHATLVEVDDEGGCAVRDFATFTGDDIEQLRLDLSKEGGFVVGEHCRKCNSRAYCETVNASVNTMMEVKPNNNRAMTHARAVEAFEKLKAAQRFLDDVRDSIAGYVELCGGSIEADGKTLYMASQRRERIKARPAVKAILAEYGEDLLAACASVNKTSVQKFIGKEAVEALREAGAIEKYTTTPSLKIKGG